MNTEMRRLESSEVRERMLQVAGELFYANGLKAVGVDRIIADSGVAKASFYRHYPSKDDLVNAFLLRRHSNWMNWFVSRLGELCLATGPRLEAVADVLEEWFREPGFRGCAFINASAEGGLSAQNTRVVQAHKAELLECLVALAKGARLREPRATGEAALLIVEGAIVRAQVSGDPRAAKVARRLLTCLGRPSA